jgi:hypothetical protein
VKRVEVYHRHVELKDGPDMDPIWTTVPPGTSMPEARAQSEAQDPRFLSQIDYFDRQYEVVFVRVTQSATCRVCSRLGRNLVLDAQAAYSECTVVL